MVFQVSSNYRIFMLAYALVQLLGCVPDIICVAQITLKFIDHALLVYNGRLLLLRGQDLADTTFFVLYFCSGLPTQLNNPALKLAHSIYLLLDLAFEIASYY